MKRIILTLIIFILLVRPYISQDGIQLTFPDNTGYWIEF